MIYLTTFYLLFDYPKNLQNLLFLGEKSYKLANFFLALGPQFLAMRELAEYNLFILFCKIYHIVRDIYCTGRKISRRARSEAANPILFEFQH
jgi:hypothetical protein